MKECKQEVCSVATAANTLYNGLAGGAAFSLAGALDTFGNPLTSIQYIRFTGGGGTGTYNIDAVSRVGLTSGVTSVPEPDAAAIFAIGALGISVLCRRNRKQR